MVLHLNDLDINWSFVQKLNRVSGRHAILIRLPTVLLVVAALSIRCEIRSVSDNNM